MSCCTGRNEHAVCIGRQQRGKPRGAAPDGYGGNLDALHDCLTDITEPTELVIRGGAALETALCGYAAALWRVLADCAAENEMFSVTWEE